MGYTGEQKREYQRKWIQARRDEWIESQGGKCAVCGSSESLEVDHIDPTTKSMQPAAIWSRAESVRLAELAKCQVLCAECHMTKTVAAYEEAKHGTMSRYTGKYQCRCAECREASKQYKRDWRSRQ